MLSALSKNGLVKITIAGRHLFLPALSKYTRESEKYNSRFFNANFILQQKTFIAFDMIEKLRSSYGTSYTMYNFIQTVLDISLLTVYIL